MPGVCEERQEDQAGWTSAMFLAFPHVSSVSLPSFGNYFLGDFQAHPGPRVHISGEKGCVEASRDSAHWHMHSEVTDSGKEGKH